MSSSKTESLSMNEDEIEYATFIKQRIENSGGSVKFQHLTGHLSQLSLKVRKAVGGGTQELMKFLRKHHTIFNIDPKGNVSIKQSADHLFSPLALPEEENSIINLPRKIEGGYGVAINVHPTFGFINAKYPFKTTVYFCPSNFENGKGTLLTDYNLFVGGRLYFDAVLGNPDFEAKYKAVRVWKPLEPEKPPDEPIKPKPRKNRDTGLYDPLMKEGEGVVHKVFPTHAFVTVEDDPSCSVFFHKNHLSKYSNVVDLSDVIKVGTVVEFTAMRSTKSDAKARWEATKVWIKGTKSKKKSSKNDEMYLSDDESVNDNYSVSSSNSLPERTESHVKTYNSLLSKETKQRNNKLLANESGQFYPRSSGSVIKFGPDLSELADADSALFYVHGAKVADKLWEFSDGDHVKFDAIRIKSAPGWKVVLGWVGNKPNVVLSSEDFGISDDEISDTTDMQVPSESFVSPSHKKPGREWKNSNYKKTNILSSRKIASKSSISSFDLESEKDSGIYVFPENTNTKESFISLADIEKGATRSLQSSRTGSVTSLNSSKGSQISNKRSKHNKIVRGPSKEHYNSSENVTSKHTSIRKSNFNWADAPCSDDEKEHFQFAAMEQEIAANSAHELHQNDLNFEDSGIIAKFGDLLANSDDEDVTDQNSTAENNENSNFMSENQNNLSNNNVSNSNFKPYIKLFEGILGTVASAYSRFIRIESKALRDSAVCGFNDIYRNGTPISDHFDDVREVVKDGDTLKFNCFEVLDDSNHYSLFVTMAWKGAKPKVDQMTTEEFLASRPDINVTIENESHKKPTCEASSKSMRLLNDESEVIGSKKYLSVVQTNIKDEDLNMNFEQSTDETIQMMNDKKEIASAESKKKFLMELQQSPEKDSPCSSSNNMLADKIIRAWYEGTVNDNSLQNLRTVALKVADLVLKESKMEKSSSLAVDSCDNDEGFQNEMNLVSQAIANQTNNFSASSSRSSVSNKAVQTIVTGEVFSQSLSVFWSYFMMKMKSLVFSLWKQN